VSEDLLPTFRLTERDCALLKAINDCRALLTRQITTMFFSSQSRCYKRLEKLFHYGFVDRHFLPQVAHAPAASPIVYTITKLGASVLATTYGYTSDQFHFPTASILAWETLTHILAINDVYGAIYRASVDSGVSLVDWRDELSFRANPDYVWVVNSRGTSSKKPVLPDGYFHLKLPQGNARFFLEVDRGTEGMQQFKSQIQVYQEYILSGGYEAQFHSKSLRILVVVPTKTRLETVRRAIAEVGGGERYWITTFDQLEPTMVLTAPIWQKAREEGLFPIISP